MPRSGRTPLKRRKALHSVVLGEGRSNLQLAPSALAIARSTSLLSAAYGSSAYDGATPETSGEPVTPQSQGRENRCDEDACGTARRHDGSTTRPFQRAGCVRRVVATS